MIVKAMCKPDGEAAWRAAYRILDGLGRLGILPFGLLQLTLFSADFLLNRAAVLWIGLVRAGIWGQAWPKSRLSAAARKITGPAIAIARHP